MLNGKRGMKLAKVFRKHNFIIFSAKISQESVTLLCKKSLETYTKHLKLTIPQKIGTSNRKVIIQLRTQLINLLIILIINQVHVSNPNYLHCLKKLIISNEARQSLKGDTISLFTIIKMRTIKHYQILTKSRPTIYL